MDFRHMSPEETQRFVDGMMSRAAAEATHRTKQELAKVLDDLADRAGNTGYLVPQWNQRLVFYGESRDLGRMATQPETINVSQESLRAIRYLLFGAP